MNIAYFLLPKSRVAYLYDDYTFRQGLEKMRHHGYTAIPVITRDGRYAGTVSEGDSSGSFYNEVPEERKVCSMKDLEQPEDPGYSAKGYLSPVRITVSMEGMLNSAMNQNFIPVVDDLGNFNGIVTRKDIIRYFAEQKDAELPQLLQKIV